MRPCSLAFTDLFEYIDALTTWVPEPWCPWHSPIQSHLDLVSGQPPWVVLETSTGIGRSAPKKTHGFYCPKTSFLSRKFSAGKPTDPPRTFSRNFSRKSEQENPTGKPRVQTTRIDRPHRRTTFFLQNTISSSRTEVSTEQDRSVWDCPADVHTQHTQAITNVPKKDTPSDKTKDSSTGESKAQSQRGWSSLRRIPLPVHQHNWHTKNRTMRLTGSILSDRESRLFPTHNTHTSYDECPKEGQSVAASLLARDGGKPSVAAWITPNGIASSRWTSMSLQIGTCPRRHRWPSALDGSQRDCFWGPILLIAVVVVVVIKVRHLVDDEEDLSPVFDHNGIPLAWWSFSRVPILRGLRGDTVNDPTGI